jgi:hypothetical protein
MEICSMNVCYTCPTLSMETTNMLDEEELSMGSVFVDAGDECDATGESDDDDTETDVSDAVTEMDSVPDFIDEGETDVSDDEGTAVESDGDGEVDAGTAPDSDDDTEMDSVPHFVDATRTDIVDQGDAAEEADVDREADASDGATEMDSTEDSIDESETNVSGVSDTTLASDGDGESDGESDEEGGHVSMEQFQQIAAIPVAEKKYSVNSLSNLCVGKILSEAMAARQATTIDRDMYGVRFPILTHLEQLINKFSNPQFRVDLDNVYNAAKVVSDTTDVWFPKYGPVVNTLRQYGCIMALVAIDTPSTRVLAANYFLASNPPWYPSLTCFGYVLTLPNMWEIMVSLFFAINNRMIQIHRTFDNLMVGAGELEAAIDKHLVAFKIKYLI